MEPQTLQAVIRQMIKGFIKMKYGLVLCSHNVWSCVYKYAVENTKCRNSFYFVLALQLLSPLVQRLVPDLMFLKKTHGEEMRETLFFL